MEIRLTIPLRVSPVAVVFLSSPTAPFSTVATVRLQLRSVAMSCWTSIHFKQVLPNRYTPDNHRASIGSLYMDSVYIQRKYLHVFYYTYLTIHHYHRIDVAIHQHLCWPSVAWKRYISHAISWQVSRIIAQELVIKDGRFYVFVLGIILHIEGITIAVSPYRVLWARLWICPTDTFHWSFFSPCPKAIYDTTPSWARDFREILYALRVV